MPILPENSLCNYSGCETRVSSIVNVYLCDGHAVEVYRVMRKLLEGSTSQAGVAFRGTGGASHGRNGVVYFIRFGDRIKIGFTTDLTRRMQTLPHDMVLATMPGTMSTEKRLHRQFAATRVTGEWFHVTPELLACIDQVKRGSARVA